VSNNATQGSAGERLHEIVDPPRRENRSQHSTQLADFLDPLSTHEPLAALAFAGQRSVGQHEEDTDTWLKEWQNEWDMMDRTEKN
jgi:hypothetical protein